LEHLQKIRPEPADQTKTINGRRFLHPSAVVKVVSAPNSHLVFPLSAMNTGHQAHALDNQNAAKSTAFWMALKLLFRCTMKSIALILIGCIVASLAVMSAYRFSYDMTESSWLDEVSRIEEEQHDSFYGISKKQTM
jgi:hypothetical protein